MKTTHSKTPHRAVLGTALCALVMPTTSLATLKYQTDDYIQDGLVVHLDGINNVGADKPHDPGATDWANLANPTNPAAITANASSGWRDDGYYFAWNSSASYAQLVSAAPAMTQATFEFACDNLGQSQYTPSWGCTFFSGTNDQRVCTVDANTIRFKADQWTGSSSYRPSLSGWSWKQASFTLGSSGDGNFKAYDKGVLKSSVSAGSTGANGIPDTRWMIASRIGQTDQSREFKGVMKSFRIYNRALTSDEVAANAKIDAARFEGVMPVTNAVVATSVAGAFGNEIPGVYAVDGSHTFTAPPFVTVDSTTYACTGYKLETWENGAWSSPVTVAGFAVTVSESEKVRITWQWESTAAKLGGYVTDGLVVWLDGIWNAGAGKPHDSTAASWANLADPSNPAAITANASSSWRNDGYHFCFVDTACSYARLANATPPMTRATLEIAFDGALSDQNAFDWGSYFVSIGANNGICGLDTSGTLCLNAVGWTGGTGNNYRPRISNWNWKQAAFTVGEAAADGLRAYQQGVSKDSRSRASIQTIPAARWYVANYGSGSGYPKYQAVGTMKAVRIYNRALSADEVAQNAAADEARFVSGSNAVEIVADPRGLAGREPAGFYVPDGWTFSAGISTQTVNGVSYAAAGYRLETWNAELSAWATVSTVQRDGGNPVEYTPPAAPFANVRLTWHWEPVAGARRAADYTVADYAQDGLAVWFDGIRNAGLDADHVSAADHAWVELVSGQSANMMHNDNSGWTSDGYRFALGSNGSTKSYAYLRKLVSLGKVGTIEISCDFDPQQQVGTWPTFLSFGHTNLAWAAHDNAMVLQSNQKQDYLRLVDDAWTGNAESQYTGTPYANWNFRANTSSGWDGRHAAFVVDTDGHRSYAKGVRDQVNNYMRTVMREEPLDPSLEILHDEESW